MTAEHSKYIQFVNLLNSKNFFSDVNKAVISPLLNCLCIITKQKNASLYLLPNGERNPEPFWDCPSKVQRCLFSEDGKSILIILHVNSFQIYSIADKQIADKSVSLVVQIKASTLTNILQDYNIDFSAACDVRPLKLKKHDLIVIIGNKLIVSMEWSFTKAPIVKYLINIESYKDIFINEKVLFMLHRNGIISAYNTSSGGKYDGELITSSISGAQHFHKLSVHSSRKILALVNQNEEIVLFDTNELFTDEKSGLKTQSEVKKEKWIWSYKRQKSQGDVKMVPYKILGTVSPPSGLVVSSMQFSLKGLFTFYCILGQTKCSSFKVVDEYSGDVLYNFDGLVESHVLPGGPLPLVMTDSILSICLGVLCNDYFIIKLCQAVPNFGFSKELERALLSQPRNDAAVFHVVFLKLILNLHLNIFYSSLLSLHGNEFHDTSENVDISLYSKKIMERTGDLFKAVLEYREDETNVKEAMLTSCFLHAVHLLDITQVEQKSVSDNTLFSCLLKQILVLYEKVQETDPLQEDWISWVEMSDTEIIQESVLVGAVGLAHVFLVTNRSWPVNEVESKFKVQAHAWIIHLILLNELEKAKTALANLGCDPVQHLKSLWLETNDCLLRDMLFSHLMDIEQCTADEVDAWNFSRRIENALSSAVKRCHTFDEKMNVSAKDRVKAISLKLPVFSGSLDLTTILSSTEEWRSIVLTEIYFSTGDVTLENHLDKKVCWRYLVETNQVDLLKNWIDISCDSNNLISLNKSTDYLSRTFCNLFAEWPITEDLLDILYQIRCMSTTKAYVLDACATYGLFASCEKNDLKAIVLRLENNSLLPSIRSVLSRSTSNVSLENFNDMFFRKCTSHSLNPIVFMCFNDRLSFSKDSTDVSVDWPWADIWNVFSNWENQIASKTILNDAIAKSRSMYECTPLESAFLDATIAVNEEKEISDIVGSEGKSCSLLQLPIIEISLNAAQRKIQPKPDVTLYGLLAFSDIPVDKLFLWQSQNRHSATSVRDAFIEFPHFNHQVLGIRFGFRQNLDHIYYLKQGRPSFACNLFVIESLRTQRRLTTKMIKRVCGVVHGLALKYWKESSIGNACIAFLIMLGDIASANVLRIHLGAIECLCHYLPVRDRYYISTLVHGVITKELFHLQEMASILEKSVMLSSNKQNPVSQLKKWCLVVYFCSTHSLPLPTLLLKFLAGNGDWFSFALCMDIFKYPYEQAIELIEEIDSKILKSHLIRALTRTTLKLSTTSPSKSPPKILLEPENNEKEEAESTSQRDNKDVFHSFVTNIYTEVLNTIQTFTDKNIVLPWSCEQDPETDVLLTLLKCESEPDTSKSLLIASIELQSPPLAVLATCFQSDNVFPNLIAWLVSSIPTSMSRMKRREEGQQLVDRLYGSNEVESLLVNFFSTGYFQTFFRGMHLFMSDNPMTIFLHAVYQSIELLDFQAAFELLKEFTVEITHFRVKELAVFYSKDCIVNVVAQCINNLLTRSDLENSKKRQFLRILAESDLLSVDPCFPNYLLWSQICEIIESSDTNLDFIQLCDITTVSDELRNCLDVLTKNHQFTQALEICSLLSLNKDEFVIAMWKHQLDMSMEKDVMISTVWKESSLAFKDENVNPNLAASFYYEMASHFQSPTTDSLKNKYFALDYCLHWRRLMEDTLSPSFREESDAIELEKWKCCIQSNFDIGVLKNSDSIEISHSLLLCVWSVTKVLIRSQTLDKFEKERVENLINMFLELGNLHKALRLSAFFKINNQDLIFITSCLKVAQEHVTPSNLAKLNSIMSMTPKKLWCQSQCIDDVDLSEYEIVPSKEQHQMLYILDKLCQTVKCGKSLANRIFVCYRLSVNLDLTFKDVASQRDYLSLLPRSVTFEGSNKFNVASDLITLADLPTADLAKLLKDKIVTAVLEFHSTDLMAPVTLWDVPLDQDFRLIINLTDNSTILGSELLQASVNLPCGAAVEVLIRAHDCFTASCNVEGIGRVLRRARILASVALQEEQWHYLVRLLVGIGRYSDMSYIFRMLKDSGQFEQLLRKGMHKVPGLHVAISEFLQRYCPQDREISKMVAAHFGLYSKLATFWQEEADEMILKLPNSDNILKDTGKTRQILNTALDNYSHSVQWFLQAGKLSRALKMAHKAQMVALQISLLGGPYILKLQSRYDLQTLLNGTLSVAQTMLISKAYDYQPDWVSAFHERWILKGDKTFHADLKSSGLLSPQMIQCYSQRYDLETITNTKAKDRMRQLISCSDQIRSPFAKDVSQ